MFKGSYSAHMWFRRAPLTITTTAHTEAEQVISITANSKEV